MADIKQAMSVIESCAGFTDESTPAGEAWGVVRMELERLRAIREPVKKCIRSLKSERETLESALREALAELEQEASE